MNERVSNQETRHLRRPMGQSGVLAIAAAVIAGAACGADRLKRTYAGRVVPDELATAPGEAVSRAVAWLLNQH